MMTWVEFMRLAHQRPLPRAALEDAQAYDEVLAVLDALEHGRDDEAGA